MGELTKTEKDAIAAFANGHMANEHDALKEAALAVFRRHLGKIPKDEWCIYMQFMSEVDTVAPDYGLRALYRKRLFDTRDFVADARS